MREKFSNNAQSTLSASATNTDTSITVASGSPFPSMGNFRLIVESEIMLCTARSGNVLTVQRGIEGTTAAAHASGVNVAQIVTTGALQQYGRDNVAGWDGSR